MAKILYLIRHGESQANIQGQYQGQSFDTDLTIKGRQQSLAAAKAVRFLRTKLIYTSPLSRSRQTAQIISDRWRLKLIEDERLLEINHGSWEGKHPKKFNQEEQLLWQSWRKNPDGVQMIKGETICQVAKRCQAFVNSLASGHYLVVTHDVVIRVMVLMVLGCNWSCFWKFNLDNGGVTTISFNPKQLISLNQNWHLNKMQSLLIRQAL